MTSWATSTRHQPGSGHVSEPALDTLSSWLDSLPESLQTSATAGALRAICEVDLWEIEGAEPLCGFSLAKRRLLA